MSEITRVALDGMGGDNAPGEIVKGAVEAVQLRKDIKILLTGQEEKLKSELAKYTYPEDQIEMSRISKWIVPAGTSTSTRSPFFLPSRALAIGVPIASFPSRRLASFSDTIV